MADDHNSGQQPALDSGLLAMLHLLAFLQIPADPDQIIHERGAGSSPFTVNDILRAAKRLGVKARSISAKIEDLEHHPLPAVAEARDGTFFLIARIGEKAGAGSEPATKQVLVQTHDSAEPQIWSMDELLDRWSGGLILMTTREALAGAKRRFDVTWFLPFLVKYRRPLIQVVVASLVIQIVGLISPIFFQLIIDKVLVHGTLTTLDVLAVGLAVVFLWETLLSCPPSAPMAQI